MKLFLRCFLFFFIWGGIAACETPSSLKLDKVFGLPWGASMDFVQRTIADNPLPGADSNTLVFSRKSFGYDSRVSFYFYEDKLWKVDVEIPCDKISALEHWDNIMDNLDREFPRTIGAGVRLNIDQNHAGLTSQRGTSVEEIEAGKLHIGCSREFSTNPGEEKNQIICSLNRELKITITYKNGELAARIPGSYEAMETQKTMVSICDQTFVLKKVIHYKNGNICSGIVMQPIDFRYQRYTLPLAIGSNIIFYENGGLNFCTLSRDTLVQAGTNSIRLKGGTICSFHENGNLNFATLATDQQVTVGNTHIVLSKCIPVGYASITFYEDGKLKEAFAGKDVYIMVLKQKAYLKERSQLHFYNNETLARGELARPLHITFHNIQLVIKDWLELYPNGMVKYGESVHPIILTMGKRNISLYVTGFYENGEIMNGYLTKRQKVTISGISLELEEDDISFYKNGRIKRCVITDECYEKTKVKAKAVEEGYEVLFDESGNITERNETTDPSR